MDAIFGWSVLALVFVDELLAVAAFAVWGADHDPGWLLVWLLPLAAVAVWAGFVSPRAPWGGRVVRPVLKIVVLGLACLALADAGHEGWAIALLVFSVVVNALAQLPTVRVLVEE